MKLHFSRAGSSCSYQRIKVEVDECPDCKRKRGELHKTECPSEISPICSKRLMSECECNMAYNLGIG